MVKAVMTCPKEEFALQSKSVRVLISGGIGDQEALIYDFIQVAQKGSKKESTGCFQNRSVINILVFHHAKILLYKWYGNDRMMIVRDHETYLIQ